MRGSFFFRLFFSVWDHNQWSFQLYAKLIVAFIILFVSKLLRLVAEISMERKMKSQKSKTKSSEGKKQQLSSVRVIQRNLVYIVGLPLNLGDEDVFSLSLHLSVSLSLRMFFPTSTVHVLNTVMTMFCSFFSGENILASMERFWKCLCLVQRLVLFSNFQTILVVCKLKCFHNVSVFFAMK